MQRGIFFSYHDDLYLEGSFIKSKSGIYFEIHPTRKYTAVDGDLIFTLDFAEEPNQVLFGFDKLSKRIIRMVESKRVVFADNETGDLFGKFYFEATGRKI